MAQESGTRVAGNGKTLDDRAQSDRVSPAAALAIWIGLSVLGWAAVIGLVSMLF
jgi:hypothetical protein